MHPVLGFLIAIVVGWVAIYILAHIIVTIAIIMNPVLFNEWKSMNYFPRDRLYYDEKRKKLDVHWVTPQQLRNQRR